jgi:hypothetical protein
VRFDDPIDSVSFVVAGWILSFGLDGYGSGWAVSHIIMER